MPAVDQAYRYAINMECDWVIVTSMRETRLDSKGADQFTFERLVSRDLVENESLLKKLLFLLGADRALLHVVCTWIGNSQIVAQKHDLQVTDEHFEKAVQNPVQQLHETRREESQRVPANDTNVNNLQELATGCIPLRELPVGGEGLETSQFAQGKNAPSQPGAAESGAVGASRDVRLQRLLNCWDELPEAVRVSVDAIVQAHSRPQHGD